MTAPVFAAKVLDEPFDEAAIAAALRVDGLPIERLIVVGQLPNGDVACITVVRTGDVVAAQPTVLAADYLRFLEQPRTS